LPPPLPPESPPPGGPPPYLRESFAAGAGGLPLAPTPLSDVRPVFVEAQPPAAPAPAARREEASILAFVSGCLGSAILFFFVSGILAGLLALLFSDLRSLDAIMEPPNQGAAARATVLAFVTFVVIGAFGLLVGAGLIGARRVSAGAGIGIGAVLGVTVTLALWLALYISSPA
jgi:hypothetical protein